MNITEIKQAIQILQYVDRIDLQEVVELLNKETAQTISADVVKKFRLTGLSNVDFLTSDFLMQEGYKNIYNF